MRNISEIIIRMREAIKATTDKVLCKHINESQSTISSWKKRGVIPYSHIDKLSKETGKPFEWFLDGSSRCANCTAKDLDDPYISSVADMMRAMDDDTKKDIQLSVQKEILLRELIQERQHKKAEFKMA